MAAAAILQERDTAQARLGIGRLFAASVVGTLGRRVTAVSIAVGLLRVLLAALLALLLRLLLLAFGAFTFAPVVALDEAAHRLDHAIIVIGILPIGLGLDAIAGRSRLTRERLIFVEDLMGIAPHPDVRPAAVEDLVSIGRTIRVVRMMLLMVLMTAATTTTTAAPAGPLPIVWSH